MKLNKTQQTTLKAIADSEKVPQEDVLGAIRTILSENGKEVTDIAIKAMLDNDMIDIIISNYCLRVAAQAKANSKGSKGSKTVVLHPIQHSLLKQVVDSCKVYRDASGTPVPERVQDASGKTVQNADAVSYTIEKPVESAFNPLSDIESKIADVVSWFRPNAKKTGKACTTEAVQAETVISDVYKAVISALYKAAEAVEAEAVEAEAVEAEAVEAEAEAE